MFNLNLTVNNSGNDNDAGPNPSTNGEPSGSNPELTADEVDINLRSNYR